MAFEVDDFNPHARTGWSVTAVGRARAVSAPAEIARLSGRPGPPENATTSSSSRPNRCQAAASATEARP
ncbi:hypothetical protein [Streptosporangium sp. NPDC051022]|uniref:hypothetical protein n=1 Tax=Streptosporangium sp. NPDC051022 TaxID=3155752 RepID=UPI003415E6F5